MKTRILSLVIIGLMAGTIVTSCGEASKKDVNNAQQEMKEASKDLGQARKDAQKEVKTTVIADWKKFRTTSETTIENTENQIKVLRGKIAKANKKEQEKLTAALDKLEQKNSELKEKLAQRNREFKEDIIQFNESAIENEQKFEREFKHDMDELGTALKDMFKNNVG